MSSLRLRQRGRMMRREPNELVRTTTPLYRRRLSDKRKRRCRCKSRNSIKLLLAGVVRPFGRAPQVQAPVDLHYVRLREEPNRTFELSGSR
jgi:hypothetical protein